MRVAVTGGTGCLGRPLIRRILEDGHKIKLLIPENESGGFLPNGIRSVQGTITSPGPLDSLTSGCETVFHLAGKVHVVPGSRKEEEEFFRINLEGTRLLLEAAARNGVRRIVFYSTVGVYGKDADFAGDEGAPCNPVSAYALSKLKAEELVLRSGKCGGPEGVVLRFPVVYGPMDRGNVALLISAVNQRRFFVPGNGLNLRSMINSENAAHAAALAGFHPAAAGRVFCVTDGVDYSFNCIIEAICRALEVQWEPPKVPLSTAQLIGKFGDFAEKLGMSFPLNSAKVRKLSGSLTFSCSKVREALGYEPRRSLDEGLKAEVAWLRLKEGWS